MIRTTSFYVTDFGAEAVTVLQDEGYITRDTQRLSGRSERVSIAVTLILRDRFALHTSIPNFKDVLGAHFSNNTIKGVGSAFATSGLRYDSKWLGDAPTHLKKMWCSLYHVLATARENVSAFDVMMWLLTMAYAESADMNVIQVLAALYKDPEYVTIYLPSAPIFRLAAGNTWRRDEIENLVQRETSSFDDSAESEIPKHYNETEKQHISRIKSEFNNGKQAAIQSFIVALRQQ